MLGGEVSGTLGGGGGGGGLSGFRSFVFEGFLSA